MKPTQCGGAESAFTGRFVLLRHTLPTHATRKSHWDLLLEMGDVLAAWELPCPLLAACDAHSATHGPLWRLPDHRLLYLDYEGPIAGDRGHVARVACGLHRTQLIPANVNAQDSIRWLIDLLGTASSPRLDDDTPSQETRLAGRLTIEPAAAATSADAPGHGDSDAHPWRWQPSLETPS